MTAAGVAGLVEDGLGGDRVVLVQAGRDGDRVPQPLDVGLAEDRRRPARVRVADDRPRDPTVSHRLQSPFGE